MSLQKCPHCKKNNDFWYIYWKLNKTHFKKEIPCQKCDKKMHIHLHKTSLFLRILEGILWMTPPVLLMFPVAQGAMNPLLAIFFVIVYHFVCFFFIIKLWRYKK